MKETANFYGWAGYEPTEVFSVHVWIPSNMLNKTLDFAADCKLQVGQKGDLKLHRQDLSGVP